MTEQAQRIAIAEECGWRSRSVTGGYRVWVIPDSGKRERFDDELPDYLNDLNACHEMEKVLSPTIDECESCEGLWVKYGENLAAVCGYNQHDRAWFSWDIYHATPAQRAKAFLLTLNLWDDTK